MNGAVVDPIVRAVLYEGYMLYPYRASAVKNQQRFNFGVIYPPGYAGVRSGTDSSAMQTQVLVEGEPAACCQITVRFLRMVNRTVQETEGSGRSIDRMEVDGRIYQPWQEAVEETIEVAKQPLAALCAQSVFRQFSLSRQAANEPILDRNGIARGFLARERERLSGKIELSAEALQPGLVRLSVRIVNQTALDEQFSAVREQALSRSLVSAHTVLEVSNGLFVSLLAPPDAHRDLALTCQNFGTWPVLVGAQGQRDTMLSSPIILYDYPEIAPESKGDLFDGAEIDEILSLRILTLTDEEKREMRADEYTRQVLERTESMPEEHWKKLHGAVRGLRTVQGEAT